MLFGLHLAYFETSEPTENEILPLGKNIEAYFR